MKGHSTDCAPLEELLGMTGPSNSDSFWSTTNVYVLFSSLYVNLTKLNFYQGLRSPPLEVSIFDKDGLILDILVAILVEQF